MAVYEVRQQGLGERFPCCHTVMADRGCQLDGIWNQLKHKLPGPLVRDVLDLGT